MNKICLLQKLRIFENIPSKDIENIDKLSKMEYYKKNDNIYLDEPPFSSIYILKEGNVKITLSNEDGKEYIVEILKPGEIFGNFGDYILSSTARLDFYKNL